MKIFVVIPNWNGADIIAKALRSLKKQTQKHQVVVVDNGSTDASLEIIVRGFPDAHLIKKDQNHGFAGGVNLGIQYALSQGANAIALFNSDAVADKDWLKNLVTALNFERKVGIVSCKQLRTDRTHIDSAGDFYSVWGLPFPRGRNLRDSGQYDEPEEVFSAPAGATLYRADLFREIGLFDEKFFAYYEDVDISFRARLAGWKIRYEPTAKVYHVVSATSVKLGSFTRYHSTKNFLMLYFKNMPGYLFWKYLPLVFIQTARLCIGSLKRGELSAYMKGLLVFVGYLPAVLADRSKIQRERVIMPTDIDKQLHHTRPPKIPNVHITA